VERSLSFGTVAQQYDDFRPALPSSFNQWLGLSPHDTVVDLAAGTGLATRTLLLSGATVIAVEPDDEMRAVLMERSPTIESVAGTAESIPLPDDSADVVVIVSAWHWVDPERAFAEIARVLHDSGRLAIAWNGANYNDPAIRELFALRRSTDGSGEGQRRHDPRSILLDDNALFAMSDVTELPWQWDRTVDEIVQLFGTYSGVITADDDAVVRVNELVRARATALADREGVVHLPMATRCLKAIRRPRNA